MTYSKNDENPVLPSVALIGCVYGFTEILENLWVHGEAQTIENREGLSGLVLAAKNDHNEILDIPIDPETEYTIDFPTKDGKTALHHAAIGGFEELARFLLGYPRDKHTRCDTNDRKRRAHVNTRDMLERTPLHYAAEFPRLEIMKLLLAEDDLDVHARDRCGKLTALGLCSRYPEAARLLRRDRRYDAEDEKSPYG